MLATFNRLSCMIMSMTHPIASYYIQVVYILDQVRALENEMLLRIQKQGLDVVPKILIVGVVKLLFS